MAPRGTIWGSICIEVTLSDIETIWTKFGQNPVFSLRNSVSLTPGPTVNLPVFSRNLSGATYKVFVLDENDKQKSKSPEYRAPPGVISVFYWKIKSQAKETITI